MENSTEMIQVKTTPTKKPSPKKKSTKKQNVIKAENTEVKVTKKTPGGANTTKSGKEFENKTDSSTRLLSKGFVKTKILPKSKAKSNIYLSKKINEDVEIMFFQQESLKSYLKNKFDLDIYRKPDECFLIKNKDKYTLRILEKKNQTSEGSVDNKLYVGKYFIEEYKHFIGKKLSIDVEYAFYLCDYYKNLFDTKEKWQFAKTFIEKDKIKLFFSCDNNCVDKIDEWALNINFENNQDKLNIDFEDVTAKVNNLII